MEDFFNFGFIKSIPDIYLLQSHREDLQRLEGYGEKSITNLIQSIENSKKNSLEKLIFGLGIPHVGSKTAKILASHFHNMDNLINTKYDDLNNISDIGDIIAKSIIEFFQDEKNISIIDKLKSFGVNMDYLGQKVIHDENFSGKTFVITGTMENYKREELKEIVENKGGKTSGSVSKKTDVVLVGKDPGSKYDKALELGITIWDEEELNKRLK